MICSGTKSFTKFHNGHLPIDVKGKQVGDRKLFSSNSDIFVSHREFLVAKDLGQTVSALHQFGDAPSNVSILKSSSFNVTCTGLSNKGYLLATCTEKEVFIWKKDAYLNEWDKKKVAKKLGKILDCAVTVHEAEIFICLSKFEEILVVRCVSRLILEPGGSLDLKSIEVYTTIDKLKEPNSWIGCFVSNPHKLNIIGMTHGTGISLRLWSVTNRQKDGVSGKLLDHKTVPQIKSIAAVDFSFVGQDAYMMILSHDGQLELFHVSVTGFWLINRIKLDDSLEERPNARNSDGNNNSSANMDSGRGINSSLKIEFRILTGRFIPRPKSLENFTHTVNSPERSGHDCDHENEKNSGNDKGKKMKKDEHENENDLLNLLTTSDKGDSPFELFHTSPCPQLLAVLASTRKIFILNLRSGEVEMSVRYPELLGENSSANLLVNNVTVSFDENSSEILGAMTLIMDKTIYLFRIGVKCHKIPVLYPNSCFLISSEDFNAKSVLRKKLKSPRIQKPLKGTKSSTCSTPLRKISSPATNFIPKWAASSSSVNSFRRPNNGITPLTKGRGRAQTSGQNQGQGPIPIPIPIPSSLPPQPPIKGLNSKVSIPKIGGKRPAWSGVGDVQSSSSLHYPPPSPTPRASSSVLQTPSSSRSVKISVNPSVSYLNGESLQFDSLPQGQGTQLPTNIGESGISQVRIASSADGKILGVGANVSPFVVLKTTPTFENLRTYKDIGRVSGVHFAFNSKYLLIADNDCRTTMMDWHQNKELMSLKFTSKFNELISSQFYFMDKFILQPEENRISLYSYAVRPTGNVNAKAGSFLLSCQNITAIAAANQFYSNFILCGLSSKSLQVFDANAEKVSLTIEQSHSRPINCIRLNEAPKSNTNATALCDFVLTSSSTSLDPIKLWDLRTAKCVTRISDVSFNAFVHASRPALSPCGRYIATGFEDNSVIIYDVRKINARVHNLKGIRSTVLDCMFDPNNPMIWCASRNGLFYIPSS